MSENVERARQKQAYGQNLAEKHHGVKVDFFSALHGHVCKTGSHITSKQLLHTVYSAFDTLCHKA